MLSLVTTIKKPGADMCEEAYSADCRRALLLSIELMMRLFIYKAAPSCWSLAVGLGDSLKLVLLLDSIAVGRSLGGIDELVGKTLGDALGVSKGVFASALR